MRLFERWLTGKSTASEAASSVGVTRRTVIRWFEPFWSGPPRPVEWACDYQGAAVPPGSIATLSIPFGLAGGTRRRASIVELTADVDVVSPDPFEVVVTEVAGLVFQDGFE